MDQNQNTSLFQMNLDAQNSYTLRSAASWAKVLGIVGIILGVLFVITGVMTQQVINNSSGYYRQQSGLSASSLGRMGLIVYVIMALVMIISSIFAFNAGNKINQGLKANDMASLNSGFANARNYFAFWAILIILFLLLVLVSLASAV